jgi:pimeloyl-ACP methyl ester carboxylesterase
VNTAAKPLRAERFEIRIPDARVAELRRRAREARLAPTVGPDDWSAGVPTSYLRKLADHWATEYDWRTIEASMNRFEHNLVTIDDIPIHFILHRGTGPAPLPLILTHGWPWTFWDFQHVIEPLADPAAHGGRADDAFDVVVPSLPGYAFSSPLRASGVDHLRVADLWAELMVDVLGFDRFGAHGGDWGCLISAQLGHKFPEHLIGVHLGNVTEIGAFNVERPWAERIHRPLPDDPALRARLIDRERRFFTHVAVQMLEHQTLSHAMHDSPVGLLAWILQRRYSWSDCGSDVESRFSKDDLLTTASLYWLTDTFGTAARIYFEAAVNTWTPSHGRRPVVEVPVGLSLFEYDAPPTVSEDWLRDYFNVTQLRRHARGGHFGAAEEPAQVVDDLRSMFRPLRRAR